MTAHKLTDEEVAEIKALIEEQKAWIREMVTYSQLAEKYGVARVTIEKIAQGKRRGNV